MNMKRFLSGACLCVLGVFVSCSGGGDSDDSYYYVSEQKFANGSISIVYGNNLARFEIAPEEIVSGGAISPNDDDEQGISVDGRLYADSYFLYVNYTYQVSNSIGTVTVEYLDATKDSNLSVLFEKTYAQILGLPWYYVDDIAAYSSVSSITFTLDMVTGKCLTNTTYIGNSSYSQADGTVQSAWNTYTISY